MNNVCRGVAFVESFVLKFLCKTEIISVCNLFRPQLMHWLVEEKSITNRKAINRSGNKNVSVESAF